jgi:hypothetical protein
MSIETAFGRNVIIALCILSRGHLTGEEGAKSIVELRRNAYTHHIYNTPRNLKYDTTAFSKSGAELRMSTADATLHNYYRPFNHPHQLFLAFSASCATVAPN